MKTSFKSVLSIMISIIVITYITPYTTSSRDLNAEQMEEPVNYQQLKGQVDYFKQAIDELGVTSPLEAANLWTKGEETRNGVYQYSVSCNELKSKMIEKWGNADESYWNIGASSPWINKCEIVENNKINSTTHEITIKYHWSFSGGDLEPTFDILTIIKNNDYWCVKDVKETKQRHGL